MAYNIPKYWENGNSKKKLLEFFANHILKIIFVYVMGDRSNSLAMSTILACKTSPVNIYLLKINNRNTGKECKICSKLVIKTPERRRCGVFIVKF